MFLKKIFDYGKQEERVIEDIKRHLELLCNACDSFHGAMEGNDKNLVREVVDSEREGDGPCDVPFQDIVASVFRFEAPEEEVESGGRFFREPEGFDLSVEHFFEEGAHGFGEPVAGIDADGAFFVVPDGPGKAFRVLGDHGFEPASLRELWPEGDVDAR